MKDKRVCKNFFSYKECWNYIRESKNFLFIILGIFLISSIFGYLVIPPEGIYKKILEYIQELIEITQGKSFLGLLSFIFFNNVKSSFFGIIFGAFFGVFPIMATFVNGYFLGFVSRLTTSENGFSVLWLLVPHGIFELPAIFLSFAIGLKLGTFFFQEKRREAFTNYFWNSIRIFVLIIFPLLVIAAIIETFMISYF